MLEQEYNYGLSLSDYLVVNGFNVIRIKNLGHVADHARDHAWAVFLLNFGTNTSRGLEFLRLHARFSLGPVLVLCDGDNQIDRVVYLELGADDCITKTTHLREILARIRVAARRRPSQTLPQMVDAPAAAISGRSGGVWQFSPERRELITPRGLPIDLTDDQSSLLDILIQHTGKALSRDFLARTLFGRALKAGDRSIDNLVVRLRRRLGEPAGLPRLVKTARAGGYFFAGFPDALRIEASLVLTWPDRPGD
jgi:DNA-binding response OmpR family regulator